MQASQQIIGATIGDAKSGFQTGDHNGWILLDGRLKTALTPTQQANATTLGIGVNIPNATGRCFTQGTLLTQIGSATIAQNQLPNVSPTISSMPVVIGGNQNTDSSSSGISGVMGWENATSGLSGWPLNTSYSTSSINGGVTQQSFIPASIGVNQFIYLGS